MATRTPRLICERYERYERYGRYERRARRLCSQSRELPAAQLVALGVRMSEANTRKLRLLERLGHLSLAHNRITILV